MMPLAALPKTVSWSGRRRERLTVRTATSGRAASRGRPSPFTVTDARTAYSCAGSGSIVSGFTGTCTSSRYGDVSSVTRMRGKASMNAM